MEKKKVYLTLQNGKVFQGYRFGADGETVVAVRDELEREARREVREGLVVEEVAEVLRPLLEHKLPVLHVVQVFRADPSVEVTSVEDLDEPGLGVDGEAQGG